MTDMDEKSRRLLQGQTIIYPITRQENVIGLQNTIKEKLPIVSETAPTQAVVRQVWIDTSNQSEDTTEQENSNSSNELAFDDIQRVEELTFDEHDN